jgi:hypothetical protein
MQAYLIVCGALFLSNLTVLGLLLCRLTVVQKGISRAMDKENFSRFNFNIVTESFGDPLETFKGLQWYLVYYAILLNGALYGISFFRLFANQWYKIILMVAAYVVFDFGLYMVVEVQFKLQQTRIGRMRYIKRYRRNHYWMTDSEIEEQRAEDHRFWRDARISVLMIAVQVFALLAFLFSLFEAYVVG